MGRRVSEGRTGPTQAGDVEVQVVKARRGRRPARTRVAAHEPAGEAITSPAVLLLPDELIPPELVAVFGDPVPPDELALWASLTPEGRLVALDRLAAVRAWDADAKAGSADAIARSLGKSRSRFYRMVSDWRSRRSLAALGAKPARAAARAPKLKHAGAHNALQKALPGVVGRALDVVEGNPEKVNVSAAVRDLRREVEGQAEKMPGDATLRAMVDREIRRRMLRAQAGHEVVFDLCAVGVLAEGDIPHVMFACVDRATSFVFGIGVGDPDASRAGYRAAALDALLRLERSGDGLAWAPKLERAQITPGLDVATWAAFFATAGRDVGADVNSKGAGVRFGGDLRRLLGDSLGRVRLLPLKPGPRTPVKISVTDARFTDAEAKARIEAGLAEHNARVLTALGGGAGTPPPGLIALLRLLAD